MRERPGHGGRPGPREGSIRLPDGRAMAYAEYGDPAGRVVLGCHGSPSSRLGRHVEDPEDYRRWGVRFVVPDRPGFGRSDPQPGRRVVDWPDDVARLLDSLDVGEFSVLSLSGGAAYALACPAAFGPRVQAVGVLGGAPPPDVPWPWPQWVPRRLRSAAHRPSPATALLRPLFAPVARPRSPRTARCCSGRGGSRCRRWSSTCTSGTARRTGRCPPGSAGCWSRCCPAARRTGWSARGTSPSSTTPRRSTARCASDRAGEDARVPRLLVVHHTPSPSLQAVLAADGVLLGTPANIGYMSGALKHFFDTVYYPCLDATVGLPYGVYVHGNDDTSGALRSIATDAGALRWKQVAVPLSLTGPPGPADLEAARELAATVAVQ